MVWYWSTNRKTNETEQQIQKSDLIPDGNLNMTQVHLKM